MHLFAAGPLVAGTPHSTLNCHKVSGPRAARWGAPLVILPARAFLLLGSDQRRRYLPLTTGGDGGPEFIKRRYRRE